MNTIKLSDLERDCLINVINSCQLYEKEKNVKVADFVKKADKSILKKLEATGKGGK